MRGWGGKKRTIEVMGMYGVGGVCVVQNTWRSTEASEIRSRDASTSENGFVCSSILLPSSP